MPGIYTAAFITSALALAIIGGLAVGTTGKKRGGDRTLLLVAIFLELPLCALAFYGVRVPVDAWLRSILGTGEAYKFLTTFYAPLTEEPAKLWPLLLAPFATRVDDRNAVRVAMALGLGFGLGEIWFLAERISHVPDLAKLPWYMLGGFISERFMVCFMHGVFTAAAVRRLRRGLVVGVLGAMGLHYVANLPIYLANVGAFGLGLAAWKNVLGVWVPVYFLAMIALLSYFAFGKLAPGRLLFGRAKCPACGTVYDRPFFGLNLLTKRYEPCPACRKWHLTVAYKEEDEAGAPAADKTGSS